MQSLYALVGFLFSASIPLLSQVVPSGNYGGPSQIRVGGGVSDFNPDFGHGRILGATVWADYSLDQFQALKGLGLEFEGRDVSFDRPKTTPIIREDAGLLGPTFTSRRFRNVRPYMKVLFGLGNIDYEFSKTARYNQSRTVTSFGGGFDLRVFKLNRFWIRTDYEYQYYPDFWINKTPKSGAPIDPQGFTLGVLYQFSHAHATN